MEQMEHFLEFLVHFESAAVHKAFKLGELSLRHQHRLGHLLVKLFDDEQELLNLELLVFNSAVFVLDLCLGNVQLGLHSLKLCHAHDILADLGYLELELLVGDRLLAQLVTKVFDLGLH